MFKLVEWEKKYSAEKGKKIIDDEKSCPSVTRALNRMCRLVALLYVLFGKLAEDPKLEISTGLGLAYETYF